MRPRRVGLHAVRGPTGRATHRGARRLRRIPVLAAAFAVAGCASSAGPPPDPATTVYAAETGVDLSRMEETSSGLYIEEIAEGVGKNAMRGDRVRIHFVGWLPDGTLFDSTLGGEPYVFELGSDEVIRGWNQGVVGMKVGGRRRLVIRPGLAYGPRGRAPQVPPNAILVFEIQLLDAN